MARSRRWRFFSTALFVINGLGVGALWANEAQVNTYTTGNQQSPSVALGAEGHFIVVWTSAGSSGSDSSSFSIQGQRYALDGTAVGGEFQINTYTTESQSRPSVAADTSGKTVVVWSSQGSGGTDSSSRSIQGQRYTSDGSEVGDEFQINTYTTDSQGSAAVAMDSDGDFVVVWSSIGSSGTDTSSVSVQGQRFDSDGNPAGDEFQINTFTNNGQGSPRVASTASGNFIVVWSSLGSSGTDSSSRSIQGQRFASDGSRVGGEFQINTGTAGDQSLPSVALGPAGDFVVVWQTHILDQSDNYYTIHGQRYASNGSPVGGEFRIDNMEFYSHRPSVAMDADGSFLVVWENQTYSPTLVDILRRRYTGDGTAVGSPSLVNTYTSGSQATPAVTASGNGDFILTWSSTESSGTDTDGWSVQRLVGGIFRDGFETGNTSAWSTTVSP